MSHTTILEKSRREQLQNNYLSFLSFEKYLVERHFNWINLSIVNKAIVGKGTLRLGTKNYCVRLYYSPFFDHRFDRIYIDDAGITYSNDIHLYSDLALCLYHPTIDKSLFEIIPLFKIIPWISEWCVYYEKWKEYGVWLGKEIKHV